MMHEYTKINHYMCEGRPVNMIIYSIFTNEYI